MQHRAQNYFTDIKTNKQTKQKIEPEQKSLTPLILRPSNFVAFTFYLMIFSKIDPQGGLPQLFLLGEYDKFADKIIIFFCLKIREMRRALLS